MTLIALEEHYAWDPASADNVVATWLRSNNEVAYRRLYDRGPLRLEQMDAAGIDFQILSLFDPGVQEMADAAGAVDLARRANDDLAETVRENPTRFGGFATLATQDPGGAAAELERAVTDLGLVGGLINGHSRGRYLDDPDYESLFGTAERLGVPIYLHPTTPHPAVMDAWFAPYAPDGLHLASNFYITTSGNFCPPAFACTLEVMGSDRVMFSVDYPMDDNQAGADFLASYPMDDDTRRKVSSDNAIRLFGPKIPEDVST